jgi:hypothetical protein
VIPCANVLPHYGNLRSFLELNMPSQDVKKTSICFDRPTRQAFASIIKHSRAANTTTGVIRGIAYKYSNLLAWQSEAEARGALLEIREINTATGQAARVERLDLRL